MKKLKKIFPATTKKHKFLSLDKSLKALSVPKNGRVALFVSTTMEYGVAGADAKGNEIVHLVFAPVDANGEAIVGAETVSLALPCPPYCGKTGGGNGSIMAVTEG